MIILFLSTPGRCLVTTSRSQPRRSYDSRATRNRILDAASREFQQRGYHATSMHDIMQLAAVPGGSVYHYFPTKKSLGLAVIEERVAADVTQTWIEPIRHAPSAAQGVAGVFDAVADGLERDGAVLGCPVNNLVLELSLTDPDFQRALRRVFDHWEQTIAQRFREDLKNGSVRDVDPVKLATLVVAAFSGAMSLAKAAQNATPVRVCRKELARILPTSSPRVQPRRRPRGR